MTWPAWSTPPGGWHCPRVHRYRRGAGAEGGHADGSLQVPWAVLFNKGFTVGFGRTHDRRYTTHLRDLIISGRARPGQVVTHHESLENAPSIYDRFDRRVDGIVKAVFHH